MTFRARSQTPDREDAAHPAETADGVAETSGAAPETIKVDGGPLAAPPRFSLDSVELEEQGNPRVATITVYLLLALIAAAIVWASVSRVDKIVVATGKLTSTSPNIVVQPIETAIVRSIDVSMGDVVRGSQVLARLDSTFSSSDVEQLRARIEVLDARIKRLTVEVSGTDFVLSEAPTTAEKLEAVLYQQRKANFEARIKILTATANRAEASLAATLTELPVLQQRLKAMTEIEQMRVDLFNKQSGSRLNLLVSINERLSLEANVERMKGSINELEQARLKASAEMDEYRHEFGQLVVEALIRAKDERNSASQQIKKAELRNEKVALVSPVDAVVLEIAKRSIGSVLREAEPLMTLVPLDAPIEAEVTIGARDIGLVKVGQTVRIKFETFPFQTYGTAEGTIRTVSRDAFPAETQARSSNTEPSFFRARISVGKMGLRKIPEGFRLLPGMTLSAEINVGDRTVISYFLYPILRGLDESIREP